MGNPYAPVEMQQGNAIAWQSFSAATSRLFPIAGREQLGRFRRAVFVPDWAHRVDDVPGGESARTCDDSPSRLQWTLLLDDLSALGSDGWAALSVYGAVDASAAHQ